MSPVGVLLAWLAVPAPAVAQATAERPPVIDMHLHAPLAPGDLRSEPMIAGRRAMLAAMDSLNVRFAVVNGVPDALADWYGAARERLVPALLFPCEGGLAPNAGRPCFPEQASFPDTAWLRTEIEAGRIRALGEITAEYLGIPPNDPRLEPYYALAEEYDIPVAIHLGPGPPGAAYESSPVPYKSPNFRAGAGRPLLLEEVLIRHPRMRIWVMHAGWPLVDEMIYVLYQHPQVHVDVGVLQWAIPRPEYRSYLRRIVEAGYASRVMFGSDGGPAELRAGIEAILEADFLTEQQKRDILFNNAARFLRLAPPGSHE